ncbi:MAG: MCP four helix bundle domain-containing protein [Proteobacteria bacterium]|nr:MCP four helix bundle domain-containing protein [Pseudomonadota bacterium]MBU1687402.1 MCP four helix bundle domain-containing protein [Pseudomonadota bacterium]
MLNFNKVTIGTKIKLGFGFLVILAITIGGVGFWKAILVDVGVSDLESTHLPLTLLTASVSQTALDQEMSANLYALHGEEQYVRRFNELDSAEDRNFAQIKKIISQDKDLVKKNWLTRIEQVATAHDLFVAEGKRLIETVATKNQAAIDGRADAAAEAAGTFRKAVEAFEKLNTEEANAVAGEALGQSRNSKTIMAIVSLGVFFFGIAFAVILIRQITRPLNRAIENLNDGSAQVASASGQVASSSQMLAEGASEQAAALEETSSSLEELNSMTRQNAGNAKEAAAIMKETMQVVDRVNSSMAELNKAMDEVSTASETTFKIIKTIDEIAFQTNLLALNAAVEAARAGEAGAGFAVVADEVRNLAMRSAEAAKNTSELIEGTVKRVNDSSNLLLTTTEAFGELVSRSAKISQLVNEISGASVEQAQGLGQINKAVTEMDMVTQQNAATAEESAAAAEELSAQAELMKGTIQDLIAMVGSKGIAYHRAGPDFSRVVKYPAIKRSSARHPAPVAIAHQSFIPFDAEGDFGNSRAAA